MSPTNAMFDSRERGGGSAGDFDDLDAKFDALFRRANERLDALVSDERFRSFGRWATRSAALDARKIAAVLDDDETQFESPRSDANGYCERNEYKENNVERDRPFVDAPRTIRYSAQLGRARLSLDEAAALGPNSIVPLTTEPNEDAKSVKLVVDGRVRARGVLLIIDGELALRVEEIDDPL